MTLAQPSRTLRGALIGAGYFGAIQAEAWKRIPGSEIVAIADAAPGRAAALAARWGFPRAYESALEMIEKEIAADQRLDFVDIATRPEPHRELTMLAASSGLHVICQKPMAPSWEDSVAMVEACETSRARLLIHENWRWQPWYREVKRLIERDAVGRIIQLTFQWRTGDGVGPEPYLLQPYFREMPRLLVHEALVHLLDTFRFLAGEIRGVFCQIRRVNPGIRGEDQAIIQVAFDSGALGLIDANRISGPKEMRPAAGVLIVDGERGSLRLSPDGRLWIADGGPELPHEYAIPSGGYRGDSVRATQAHIIDCLRTGKPCESEGREYLNTVAAVEACYRSVETGRVESPLRAGGGA